MPNDNLKCRMSIKILWHLFEYILTSSLEIESINISIKKYLNASWMNIRVGILQNSYTSKSTNSDALRSQSKILKINWVRVI